MDFYNKKDTTAIAKFKHIEDDKKEYLVADIGIQNLISAQDSTINYHQNTLQTLLTEINDSINANATFNSLISNINMLNANIALLYKDIGFTLSNFDSLKLYSSQIMKQANEGIEISKTIEANKQKVNDIYLETIARGIFDFTPEQVARLFEVANQCILSGGIATVQARAMYALVNNSHKFEERDLCTREGIEYRVADKNVVASSFNLYPNPANDLINITYEIDAQYKVDLEITDVLGRAVMKKGVPSENTSMQISTKNYPAGIYHCRIICNGNVTYNKKFAVTH